MEELTQSGEWIGGEGLADPSNTKTVRVRDRVPAVTDGPFVESKEQLAGYCIVDCESRSGRSRSPPAGRTRGTAAHGGAADHGRRRRGDVSAAPASTVEDLLRELAPQVLGALVRRYGAVRRLRGRGPGGAARRRRAVARRRACREQSTRLAGDGRVAPRSPTSSAASRARRRREDATAALRPAASAHRRRTEFPDRDDTLTLLFLCCHPALSPASQLALTLRAVGGLTTAQIAQRVPGPGGDDGAAHQPGQAADQGRRRPFEPAARGRAGGAAAASCCTCCTSSSTRATRPPPGPICSAPTSPARRSGSHEWLHRLLPEDGEVAGLLALMLLTDARRPARTRLRRHPGPARGTGPDAVGPDAHQRGRRARSPTPLAHAPIGPYQLQAAIAAVHDEAPTAGGHRLAPDPRAVRAARAPGRRTRWSR